MTAAGEARATLVADLVSERAARHAEERLKRQRSGAETARPFCLQREDVHTVRPAEEIDPVYARAVRRAAVAGVIVLAHGVAVNLREIVLRRRLETRW